MRIFLLFYVLFISHHAFALPLSSRLVERNTVTAISPDGNSQASASGDNAFASTSGSGQGVSSSANSGPGNAALQLLGGNAFYSTGGNSDGLLANAGNAGGSQTSNVSDVPPSTTAVPLPTGKDINGLFGEKLY